MSSTGKFKMNDGDWVCSDPQCGNVNFARRTTCNRCGKASSSLTEKTAVPHRKKLGHEIGKAAAEKSRGLFSADDWQCGRCGNVNWARRQQCNMCNAPKFGEVEERTGLGGGYNERENIEYIDREESDGEYDDFGRKKKKFRGTSEDEVLEKVKPPKVAEDEEQKEVPKYKVNNAEEEEEDEDDDDDDADLSKYDLTGWGDDSSPKDDKKNKTEHSPSRSHSSASSQSSAYSRSRSRSSSRSSVSSRSSQSSSRSSSGSDRPGKSKRKHSRSRSSSSDSKGYNNKRRRSGSSDSRSVSRERDRSRSNSPVNHRR